MVRRWAYESLLVFVETDQRSFSQENTIWDPSGDKAGVTGISMSVSAKAECVDDNKIADAIEIATVGAVGA